MAIKHFFWIFRGVRSAQQAEFARFGQTSIGSPEHLRRTASSWTTPTRPPLRQPRLRILTRHLIRRTPFRPPAYVHRDPLQLPITACACPRHTSRRRTYTAAHLNLQLLPELVPGTPAALLIIKDKSEIPAAGRDPQKPHPRPLPRKRTPALPASTAATAGPDISLFTIKG